MLPLSSSLDLLTREEVESIPRSIELFDHVYSMPGARSAKMQLIIAGMLIPKLLLRRYDIVIDLQNNIISQFVRKSLFPKAWSAFDRYSPKSAGERNRATIEAIGLGKCSPDPFFKTKNDAASNVMLMNNGWDGTSELIVINPSGAFVTRNWPIDNYVEFARLWIDQFPQSQFVIIGVNTISEKAAHLKDKLGDKLINLVNQTNPGEAFGLLQKANFVLTEDSGLMHMSWVSGIPTLAMFGSTDSIRATPLGDHTLLLDSSDLECGNCMKETCKYGDVHCLTRYSAEFVFGKAAELLAKVKTQKASSLL